MPTPILSPNASFIYPALGRVDSASIEPLAIGALRWIKDRYGRNLLPGERTERFDSHFEPILWLKDPVVEDVTAIRVNEEPLANWAQIVRVTPEGRVSLIPRGAWLGGQRGRFWNQQNGFSPGIDNVEIDYVSSGATQSEIDLYVGCVANWWADANRRSGVVFSESLGDRSYTMRYEPGEIPAAVKAILSGLLAKRAG